MKETINLLSSRIPETAVVGKDITEATNFRAYFIATALEPSKVQEFISLRVELDINQLFRL